MYDRATLGQVSETQFAEQTLEYLPELLGLGGVIAGYFASGQKGITAKSLAWATMGGAAGYMVGIFGGLRAMARS